MSSIKIVTDSTVDLSQEVLDQFNITMIPLSLTINQETYVDRVDITPKVFMEKMKDAKEIPKSSQPPIGQFVEVYDRLGTDGSEVLSIHMASKLSGTVRAAESAAGMSDTKVTVIDSRSVTRGLAFQVLEAAKMAMEGKGMDEIVSRIRGNSLETRFYIYVDTLENLVKGGRIGKGKALIGSLLHIKPIASLEDGEYTPITKVRSYSQVLKNLSKRFIEDFQQKTIKKAAIMHADGLELATQLKKS